MVSGGSCGRESKKIALSSKKKARLRITHRGTQGKSKAFVAGSGDRETLWEFLGGRMCSRETEKNKNGIRVPLTDPRRVMITNRKVQDMYSSTNKE